MKVYVQTDIEGVCGFVFFENRQDTGIENYYHRQRMYRLLTNEVNAAVKGSYEAGADYVVVNDSHGSGYNILFEDLDPRCEIIHGRNMSGPHWLPELDDSFDALVLVGMHAMAGATHAVCPHSRWSVNDGELYLSEASMAAAIAGDYGVPTVFVSGDQTITGELKEKIPQIRTAVVKHALATYCVRSVVPARACHMIFEGVKDAVAHRDSIAPFKVPGSVRLALMDSPQHRPPFTKVLEEDVVADTIDEAFMGYEAKCPWAHFNVQHPDGYKFP